MSNNIKILGNIVSTNIVTRYTNRDNDLISSKILQKDFGKKEDYIENYIYDIEGNLLEVDYNYLKYKLPPNVGLNPSSSLPIIEIDPVNDLKSKGYSTGEFKIQYNFFHNKISSTLSELFIKEISDDRKEIKVISTILTDKEIEEKVNAIINEINESPYYIDYLINFGYNEQVVAVNIQLNKDNSGYEILFKLYQPLPLRYTEKDRLWVVEEKVNPYIFDINLSKFVEQPTLPQLKGPNFDIEIENQGTTTTTYSTYTNLLSNLQSIQSSSFNQLSNLLSTHSININVDYTDFSNFTFFGSGNKRLVNFYSKVKQIEDYNTLISRYTPYTNTTSSLSKEISLSKGYINDIISKFDGYEYYLYFNSGSFTWPKTNALKPYTLYSTGSSTVISWYENMLLSSSIYDNDNQNNLINTVPDYIADDCDNSQYLVFLNMMGQYFDNIWIFIKSITDINKNKNNLNEGISKDLVYHVLKSLGISTYNSQGNEDIDQFLLGNNSGSANFDNNFSATGSFLNNIPKGDLLAEIYKRIYHNLPLLLKTKGTVPGLENLISTFGITGSILNVKEYGGDISDNNLGYSKNKVRIIQNNITGSTLSPYISVQQPISSSSNILNNDLHYIEVAFSPENQINEYVSASIEDTNPSFNLDNYIGDPRQIYSLKYPDLDEQRKYYFAPFNPSYLDYNGFIRLIQFFDNSLFQMLKDFTPARTNVSTGVTIKSPVLERNKVAYSIPLFTTESIKEAEYSAPSLSAQYDNVYTQLQGDKKPYYNGEIEGSELNIHEYFEDNNINPYLHLTSSIDLNTFNHSEFNVILNNVSSSVVSSKRRNWFPIYGTTSSIFTPAELQDSYLSLKSYNTSRYEGSKLTSLLYNNYTPATSSYIGDKSYGKTAVIDHNTRKLGLFTQVSTSSFLPGRNSVSIKYLVDEFGGLTELNQRNKYWFEIQNTFIAGDLLNISLFDNKKYSNQKFTDGNKLIFDSGYTYSPLLYFAGSCPSILYFLNLSGANSYYSKAQNSANENEKFISGSIILGHPFSSSFVSKLYDQVVQGNQYFSPGTETTFPSYSAQETGQHYFSASLDLTIEYNYTSQVSSSWYLEAWKSGSSGYTLIKSDNYQFKAGDPATATLTFVWYKDDSFRFTLNEAIPSTNIEITYAKVDGYEDGICNSIIASDNITDSNPLTIVAGDIVVNGFGDTPFSNTPVISNYKMIDSVTVNGTGSLFNNDTFIVGGTTVTLIITNTSCTPYW